MPQQASCGWHGRSMHIFHERAQPERLHHGGSGRGMNAEPASSFVPLKYRLLEVSGQVSQADHTGFDSG